MFQDVSKIAIRIIAVKNSTTTVRDKIATINQSHRGVLSVSSTWVCVFAEFMPCGVIVKFAEKKNRNKQFINE